MSAQAKTEKLSAFYRDLCVSLVGGLRALSLYPQDHPETKKKLSNLFQRLTKYLDQRSSLTLLFVNGEVVVENIPLPELSGTLAQLIQRLEAMKFQRLLFSRGLTSDELIVFLQLLLSLLKNPSGADLVIAKNQDRLPHVLAGTLPLEAGPQLSYEEVSGALQVARQSVLSFSGQLKDLFTDLDGPLTETKVTMAKETTETIQKMVGTGQVPLKILIYRRNTDPDPYIHAINVSALSMALAQRLDLEEAIIHEVGLGGLLHDIGLHLSPSAPLSKTKAITLDEKKRQWEHPIRGAEILMATPGMPDLVPMVAYEHHLQYDGGGYPKQERPRQLNLASMITCITDTYDNLRRNHAKRAALSLTDALNWMDRQVGTRFHPLLLKEFRALVKAQAQEEL
jgi:HD-GYP domain-containing protein (c-di-GMP phosphodiesterase class II)